MSNMNGYNDYNGPSWSIWTTNCATKEELPGDEHFECPTTLSNTTTLSVSSLPSLAQLAGGVGRCIDGPQEERPLRSLIDVHEPDEDDGNETNPLQVGFWMEGDSLAPPCGCTISTIHSLLEFAGVSSTDVLYDFGCGDGRVCLEAFARYNCCAVGVEIEVDLVKRANELLEIFCCNSKAVVGPRPRIIHEDLRIVIKKLMAQTEEETAAGLTSGAKNELLPFPSVVVLYLLPEAISVIQESLITLLRVVPNLRVLCNTWGLSSLHPMDTMQVRESTGAITVVYLYTAECLPPGRPYQ